MTTKSNNKYLLSTFYKPGTGHMEVHRNVVVSDFQESDSEQKLIAVVSVVIISFMGSTRVTLWRNPLTLFSLDVNK